MIRQRIPRCLALLSVALLLSVSLPLSAQDDPAPAGRDLLARYLATGAIAYVGPGTDGTTTDIYLMTAADGVIEFTNITNTDGANEVDPVYSPNGAYLAYLGEANPAAAPGVQSLYVARSDGSERVQITPDGVNVHTAAFNPASTQVAFSAQWGSPQHKIYRADIDGANPFTLTSGEDFLAFFPVWRTAGDATEILYVRIEQDGTSQIHALDPLRATTQPITDGPGQKWMLQPLVGDWYTLIQREDDDHDWEIAVLQRGGGATAQSSAPVSVAVGGGKRGKRIDVERGAAFQLLMDRIGLYTDNETNDCCAVWGEGPQIAEPVTVTEGNDPIVLEAPAAQDPPAPEGPEWRGSGIYYLSDEGEDGRDVFFSRFEDDNFINLTENDDRLYTGIMRVTDSLLMVGHIVLDDGETTPRLGFSWNLPDVELGGDYTYEDLTEGSDPVVQPPISLAQLEGLADAGLLQTCLLLIRNPGAVVRTEPRDDAPVAQTLNDPQAPIEVDGILPGPDVFDGYWFHLTDGTWIKQSDVTGTEGCYHVIPRIDRESLAL